MAADSASVSISSLPRPSSRIPTGRLTLPVSGRNVDVLTVGSPTGEPVLFLHGYAANPFVYLGSLVALARRGRYVIAPALPSFGRSTVLPLREQNVTGVAEHMALLLSEHFAHLGPVDVVGHSFGGGVSLRLTALHSELVRSLTLICPVGGAGDGASRAPAIVRGLLCGDGGHRWVLNAVRHFLPALVKNAPAVVVTGLAAWFSDQMDDVAVVDRLGIPVRFLFAKQDRLVRPGQIPAMVSTNISVEHQEGRHSWLIGESDRFVEVVLGSERTPGALAPDAA